MKNKYLYSFFNISYCEQKETALFYNDNLLQRLHLLKPAQPRDLLSTISNQIINEVKGINQVAYDISSNPPSTIEWE